MRTTCTAWKTENMAVRKVIEDRKTTNKKSLKL